jgi:hypothetical protein
MKRETDAKLSRANPVSRAAAEGPARAIGGDLLAAIVAEPREAPARPHASPPKRNPLATGRRVAGRRAPRLAAAALACLAVGGTAMAATGAWDPLVGSSSDPATLSETPVPSDLVAQLAVLRHAPTAQDHSVEVEATLAGAEVPNGVRLDSVRYLAPGANGEATILLSGMDFPTAYDGGQGEPLCVIRSVAGDRSPDDPLCFDFPELVSGHAYAVEFSGALHTGTDVTLNTGTAFGVVPDGVATVTAEFGSASERTVQVTNNYWEMPLSGSELMTANDEFGIRHIVLRDAGGTVVPQQGVGN